MSKHGGKREGAGRKSKAEELELPELIEDVIGIKGKRLLLKKIYIKAKKGSYPHQQLLMAYIYGKPTETKKIEIQNDLIIDIPDAED